MTPLAIAALTAVLMPAGNAAVGSDAGRMAGGGGSPGGRLATVAASSLRPPADVALVAAGVARLEGATTARRAGAALHHPVWTMRTPSEAA